MIKILFHIDTLVSGGAEKVLCNLIKNLNKTVFDITVVTLFPVNDSALKTDGVVYKSIFPHDSNLHRRLYRLEAELGLIYPLHIKNDYDIECAYLECGPTKVIASSTNKKAKKLAWVHCDFSVAFDESFAEKTKKYYKKFDKIVCVSEKCKESFIEMFGWSDNVDVLYNVIDDKEIIEKSLLPLPKDVEKSKLTLCTVGRFSPQKNYPRLLKTCAKLRDDGFDFDLWILGDGAQRELIEQMISELELQDRVTLFGFQGNPYPFIKAADLLVCSSNYEGFSTFITEGLILGKPIVTTDCSGMRELLGESEFGLITTNTDDGFYDGLKNVISNKNEIELFCSKAKHRGLDFRTEKLSQDTEHYLKNEMN